MKHSHRVSVLLAVVTLLLATPGVAGAKPTSTYGLEHAHFAGSWSSSFDLALDETGAGTLHYSFSDFVLFACDDGGLGSRTTTATGNGAVTTALFAVDRKLSSFAWSGTVVVASSVTTYCPSTGSDTVTTNEAWVFEFEGAAVERLTRTRIDGDRVLSSTLDPLSVSSPTLSYLGVGKLTETISNG